jgi:hypothetical protein
VLARDAWGGVGFLLVFLALVNSIIANQNAANNSSTRTMFAMGRIKLLPQGFDRLNPFGSPLWALVAQLVVSLAVALYLGFHYDPVTGFALTATILVDIFAPMYILLNIACLMATPCSSGATSSTSSGTASCRPRGAGVHPGVLRRRRHPGVQLCSTLPSPLSYAGGRGGLAGDRRGLPQRVLNQRVDPWNKRVFDEA